MVRIPKMGSTKPESTPNPNDLRREHPEALRGMEIMAPSGKFCMAIPSASARAPLSDMPASPMLAPANVTPTAIPSGML